MPGSIFPWLSELAQNGPPFIAAATATSAQKVNVTRVVEAVVIAMIAGGVAIYGTARVNEAQNSMLADALIEQRQDVRQLQAKIGTLAELVARMVGSGETWRAAISRLENEDERLRTYILRISERMNDLEAPN